MFKRRISTENRKMCLSINRCQTALVDLHNNKMCRNRASAARKRCDVLILSYADFGKVIMNELEKSLILRY